ncbi:MAG: Ulp1 family isopeptidase [Candidatus Rhabdochlamydia sp.]
MITNPINNYDKQSFQFKSLRIIQSFGWVVLVILALPTVIGSCFAWKKLVAIWDKNERPDTEVTNLVASNALGKTTTESLLNNWAEKAPNDEKRLVAKWRILKFLSGKTKTINLSYLNLRFLPDIFNDKRFSELKELNLIGNPLATLPPTLKNHNLTALIRFQPSSLRESQKPNQNAEALNLIEEGFDDIANEVLPIQTPLEQKEDLYEQAILQFQKTADCLGSRSAEAYFDYLKSTEKTLSFHFNMDLLHNVDLTSDVFLKRIKEETELARQEKSPLIFVPFLLEKNLVHEQHIVVAVINTTKHQIEYFDPKGNQLYSIFGSVVDRNLAQWNMSVQEFLKSLSQSVFSKEESSIIRNINGPQPLWDKINCGAHVLNFIQIRMYTDFAQSDKHPDYFKTSLSSDAKQLRQAMANTLDNFIFNN